MSAKRSWSVSCESVTESGRKNAKKKGKRLERGSGKGTGRERETARGTEKGIEIGTEKGTEIGTETGAGRENGIGIVIETGMIAEGDTMKMPPNTGILRMTIASLHQRRNCPKKRLSALSKKL